MIYMWDSKRDTGNRLLDFVEEGEGRDDLREYPWNMYIITCEMDLQSRFDAWDRVFRAGALRWPEGWDGEGGGRGLQDGEQVHPWLIDVNVWQKPLQYWKLISLQLK